MGPQPWMALPPRSSLTPSRLKVRRLSRADARSAP